MGAILAKLLRSIFTDGVPLVVGTHSPHTLRNPISTPTSVQELQSCIKDLEDKLHAERTIRYRLAQRHGVNPNLDKGLLDVLPTEIVAMILEKLLVDKSRPLFLNHLLVKPKADSTYDVGDGQGLISMRYPFAGLGWSDMEANKTHVIEGKFVHKGSKKWQWQAAGDYQNIWNVLNTCKAFRQIGLPIMFEKNTWVLSPTWGVSEAVTQRYWCVQLDNYKGPWQGVEGIGRNGRMDIHIVRSFGLDERLWPAAGRDVPSIEAIQQLANRDRKDREYICVPRGLFDCPNPLLLIKTIRVGVAFKAHVSSDAAHFLTETLQFLSRYRDFANLEVVELVTKPSWRTTFEHRWGGTTVKDKTVEAVLKVIQDNAVWCKDKIKVLPAESDDSAASKQIEEAATIQSLPGTRSLYPRSAVTSTPWSYSVVVAKVGKWMRLSPKA